MGYTYNQLKIGLNQVQLYANSSAANKLAYNVEVGEPRLFGSSNKLKTYFWVKQH